MVTAIFKQLPNSSLNFRKTQETAPDKVDLPLFDSTGSMFWDRRKQGSSVQTGQPPDSQGGEGHALHCDPPYEGSPDRPVPGWPPLTAPRSSLIFLKYVT